MEKRLGEVQKELEKKIVDYQTLETQKNELGQEILVLRGKLEILQELCQTNK